MAAAPPGRFMRLMPSARVLLCAGGIIGSLLMYAFLQERIMTKPYMSGPEDVVGERFGSTALLVVANRLAAAFIAAIVLFTKGDLTELKNSAPLYKYFMISVSNVCATMCQYEALKWVSFPTQTLAKCLKMIPVMIWGTFMSSKSYSPVEYMVSVAVAIGCTIFLVSGNIKAKHANTGDSWFGLLLMAGYLGFDGFTSTFQEKLFKGYSMSIYNQMLYVNLCSSIMATFVLASSGHMFSSFKFVQNYPQILSDMAGLSISAVSGQFAITYTIKEFGALLYATIMTIRQFLSVFLSNIIYMHGMNFKQWFGATVVFTSLFYKSYYKASRPKSGPKVEPSSDQVPLASSNSTSVSEQDKS